MTDFKLTERQQNFASIHHKVLEDFLRYRGLPFDEFYDVVVFRFLRAVKQYDENAKLRQYSFKTIAKNHMRSALSNYYAQQRRRNKNIQFLSLDYPLSYDPGLTLGDTVADESVNVCEEVCDRLAEREYALERGSRRLYRIGCIEPYTTVLKTAA